MKRENIKLYAAAVILIAGVCFLSVVFVRHVLFAILPFVIAWTVAFITRPVAKKLSLKTKLPEKLIRCVLSVLTVLAFFSVVVTLIWQGVGLIFDILTSAKGDSSLIEVLWQITKPGFGLAFGEVSLPEEMVTQLGEALRTTMTSILEWLGSLITVWVSNVPKIFVFLIVTVISMIYFSWDLEGINERVRALLPDGVFNRLVGIKDGFLHAGVKYIGSYFVMMLMTFLIMLFGLIILGVERAPLISILIAALDVLPVIGVGTILIPWSVIQIAVGNHTLGIGLAVLFLVNEITRQFAEPKILGKNLNTHPLVTLFLVYAGYSVFGIKGLLLVPFITVIINLLLGKNDSAKIN